MIENDTLTNHNTSRYYQISDVALFEYEFNEQYDKENLTECGAFTHHKMSEFAPYVYNLRDGNLLYVDTKTPDDLATNNTAKFSAIPYDYKGNTQFYIKDSDDDVYKKYEQSNLAFGSKAGKSYDNSNMTITFDKVRIYYINGYYFDTIEGFFLNLYVNRDDARFLSLYRKFISKSNVGKLFKYLERPLFISNRIYDKYIEFYVPSVKYLCSKKYKDTNDFVKDMNVSDTTPLKVEYTILEGDDIINYNNASSAEFDVVGAIREMPNIPYSAQLFSKEGARICALPQSANSDRLKAHIELSDSSTAVSFCGMWDNEKLSNEIVAEFNSKIMLYDMGQHKRNVNLYDVTEKPLEWVAYHEVLAKFYSSDSEVIDGNDVPEPKYIQTYNFTQPFGNVNVNTDDIKYKPVIPRDGDINTVVFEYTFRLINLYDDVQFMRKATLSASGNSVYRLMNGTIELGDDVLSNIKNYTIYNKIEQVNQSITTPTGNPYTTQYTKVFYNTNDIKLDENGNYVEDGNYTLRLSNAPKNYKFIFRKNDADGNLTIFDLSEFTLILYSKDANGNDIIIDATYSSNMNPTLGEIEFYISANNVTKLKNVSEEKRFMSILVVNNDNTKYSMFDFTYI